MKDFTLALIISVVVLAGPARAQRSSSSVPPQLDGIGIDQRLGVDVPLDLTFRDTSGRAVTLRQYFHGRPVVLALVYYECPMLCNLLLNGLVRSLRALEITAGQEFEVVTLSFDPGETVELARAKQESYLERYGREDAKRGWHFLTGDEAAIRSLTEAVGFRYRYVPETDQYAHASALVVLTPRGEVSRYLFGVEYAPRDLRLAIVEASEGSVGSVVDSVLLYCFQYDPLTGTYGLLVMRVVRLAGVATVIVLGAFVGLMVRRERRKKRLQQSRSADREAPPPLDGREAS